MLVMIEKKKPTSYHTMMATLFDEARCVFCSISNFSIYDICFSDGQAFISHLNDEQEDLELIDWDAMPEDPVLEDPASETY